MKTSRKHWELFFKAAASYGAYGVSAQVGVFGVVWGSFQGGLQEGSRRVPEASGLLGIPRLIFSGNPKEDAILLNMLPESSLGGRRMCCPAFFEAEAADLGVDSPFFSTILLFKTQPFSLRFRRVSGKTDPQEGRPFCRSRVHVSLLRCEVSAAKVSSRTPWNRKELQPLLEEATDITRELRGEQMARG